jgi:hypothetical protein
MVMTRRIGKISKTRSLTKMPINLAVDKMGRNIGLILRFTSVGQSIPFFIIGILDGMIGFLNSMVMLFDLRIGGTIPQKVSGLFTGRILNG